MTKIKSERQHVWIKFWHWFGCEKCGVIKNPEGSNRPCSGVKGVEPKEEEEITNGGNVPSD